MTGFKSGSAGDPFSNSGDSDDDNDEPSDPAPSLRDDTEPRAESSVNRDQHRDTDRTESPSVGNGLPWIYERDSITDGRAKTVQLHLQQSTLDRQREARTDVGHVLGESVKKADLREAALLVGLEQIDDVADQLREWGYDFE
ncbi:hypothetical protein [Natrinema salinisoli]|uniref:hypothetical protein n=1 Tax=Natrinema salinisoli TaxID=2878535 RepID=UPI001CEFFFC3|nr:hypothetical protein [Natrinema salinisoli]